MIWGDWCTTQKTGHWACHVGELPSGLCRSVSVKTHRQESRRMEGRHEYSRNQNNISAKDKRENNTFEKSQLV